MVCNVESFDTSINIETFGDFELSANRRIDIKVAWLAQHIVTSVPKSPYRILGKGCRIDPLEFCFRVASACIEGYAGYSVGTIEANASSRVVEARERVDREAGLITHERRDLPVAQQERERAIARSQMTKVHHAGIEQVRGIVR